MMIRPRTTFRVLAAGVLVVSSLIGIRFAYAATNSNWQTPLAGVGRLGTLPDGSVAALITSQAVTHVSAAGAQDWTQSDATADQGPIADSNGNVYWTTDPCPNNACQGYLVSATSSGAPRWSTLLPTYTVVPIKDGPDGLIYAATSQLVGVSKADGHVAFTSAMDWLPGDEDALFPFSGGVAVVAPDALTFYSTSGATLHRYPLGSGVQERGVGTPDGTVYVVRRECGQGITTLTKFTPSAQIWQEQIVAAPCAAIDNAPYLAALPDGGIAINLGPDGTFGQGETVYNTDGSLRWQMDLPLPAGAWRIDYEIAPVVDTAGTIAVAYQFAFPCQNSSDTCWGVQTIFFDASNGHNSLPHVVLQVPDPSPESYGNPLSSIAIAPGQLYLSLTHLNGGQYSSTTHDTPLISTGVSGLGAAWPQAAVWGQAGPPPPTQKRYVALGDSYSSGEGAIDSAGNAAFDTGTDTSSDKCHRSSHAYAYQLKTARAFTDPNFKFAACSGAVVPDFVAKVGLSGQWAEGPQLDAIASPGQANTDTKLVTLSLGGNDAGFPQIMKNCLLGFGLGNSEKSCLTFANTTSTKGFKLLSSGGYIVLHPKDNTWVFCTGGCLTWGPKLSPKSGYIALTVPSLSSLYARIRDRAPNAKIRVLLYPHLFPAQPPSQCTVGTFTTVAGIVHTYQMTKNEMTTLNKLGDTLNTTISAQVAAAHLAGIDVVTVDPNVATGPFSGFSGHAICDVQTPWINGVLWNALLTDPSPFSFHPNALGQAQFGIAMQLSP